MTAAEHLKAAGEALDKAAACLAAAGEKATELMVRGPVAVARADAQQLSERVRLIARFSREDR